MTSPYNDQYYFIRKVKLKDTVPSLRADDTTSHRDYATDALPPGPPLVFHNVWKERNREEKVKEQVGDILFEGANILVRTPIRERLLEHELAFVHLYPAIYIDDQDKWREDYWYVTFTRRFDCWSRKTSEYEGPPVNLDGTDQYEVDKFDLDTQLLDKTPLSERRLFKMGGTIRGFVTVHQSLMKAFQTSNLVGCEFVRVSEYG